MAFHWSLSDKSPPVSRTLLSILAVLNNVVVWMVSAHPPTSKSSSPFSNPLATIPNAPITIGMIVTCMFHSFFNSLARSRYLSFFSYSFSFILWSAGTAKSTILQVLFFFFFFFFLLVIIRSGLLTEYYYYSLFASFFFLHLRQMMSFPWIQESSEYSRADLNNVVVYIVSIRPPISNFPVLFPSLLGLFQTRQ